MSRIGRIVFFAAFVAVIGTAAWMQFTVQRSSADDTSTATTAVGAVLDSVVQSENAVRDYVLTRDPTTHDAYTASRSEVQYTTSHALDALTDPALREQLQSELAVVDEWKRAVDRDVTAAASAPLTGTEATEAAARGALLARIRAANNSLLRAVDRHGRDTRDDAGLRGLLVIVGCCALFAVLNWFLFVRTERREARARDGQLAFAERLQAARSEDEARGVLSRHLEEMAPGTIAMVTGPDDHSAAGRPIVAGGERVGTVILRSPRDLDAATERLVHDSILRAAPVLTTLHTLTVAQARAATDPLTGLGNRRLVEDALGRIAAQSLRTGERFAIAVVDLDRFKTINDTYGHAAGDALLVAIAGVLSSGTREYDVVGRQGGDEFIVLLAGLDAPEALAAMERCRLAIADVRLGRPPIGITASFGVATSAPGVETDAASLVRAADTAVYAAKARGGNCVVAAAHPRPQAQASALRA
jgi:diguanylate cyclase (GGDEF)-like protein